MTQPLILITNDDGVESPGLRAAAAALYPLGELVVAAPLEQHSGAGRSFSRSGQGRIQSFEISWDGRSVQAYGVDGSPVQAVLHGMLELAPRLPDLVVVGINYGENLGSGITASGTVGAALEAAAAGVPALAVSLQTAAEYHFSHSAEIDFDGAAYFVRLLARRLVSPGFELPFDVDLLKVDVPDDATHDTPWRVTRASRQNYFKISPPQRERLGDAGPLGVRTHVDWSTLEHDSDIYALLRDRVVSVAPLSLDLSSRVERGAVETLLSRDGASARHL